MEKRKINFKEFIEQAGVILVDDAFKFDINKWEEEVETEVDEAFGKKHERTVSNTVSFEYKLDEKEIEQIINKLKNDDFSFVDYIWYKQFLKKNNLNKEDINNWLKNIEIKEYKIVDLKQNDKATIIVVNTKIKEFGPFKLNIKLDFDTVEDSPVILISFLLDSKKKENKKIIFLDIDGVLNCSKSKVDKSIGYIGIDDDKLARLRTIIDKTDAEIVLCSSWKDDWFPELSYKNIQGNCGNLIDKKFLKFGIKILDKTNDEGYNRGRGILDYCFHNNIDNFVILDDETFDYKECDLLDNLIQTSFEGEALNDEIANKVVEKINNFLPPVHLSDLLKDKKFEIQFVNDVRELDKPSTLKCIGTIGGDIIGSQNEFTKSKRYKIDLFNRELCYFTDDTVMTIAVMDYFINNKKPSLPYYLKKWFLKYPHAGYGGRFTSWCLSTNDKPYNSYGNGSAMRVSPVVYVAKSLDECLALAKETAEVTHNHPEGIKGAQAIAGCAYLAKEGKTKKEIEEFAVRCYPEIKNMLKYPKVQTKILREEYEFDVTCQGSCPIAIYAFLISDSYEDMNWLINYIGGDTDTIGAMGGIIAETFYGITKLQEVRILSFLSEELIKVIIKFSDMIKK